MARNNGGTESLQRKIRALNATKDTLPIMIGNTCETFFKNSFKKQGWDDQSTQKWKPRKGEIGSGGIAMVARKSNSSRAVLVKTGALRRSIHTAQANWRKVVVESDLPYSAIHNYGEYGNAWGKHKFKMPQRKFMGNSYNLRKKITETMERQLNKVFTK